MKYDKCKCDGCSREFDENDDVVVCPVCGTPQHRECYKLKGECVNAARHAEGFVWQDAVAQSEIPAKEDTVSDEKQEQGDALVCPNCGHENEPGSKVCEECGTKFTLFGINILEKQMKLEKEIEEEEKAREQEYAQSDENGNTVNGRRIIRDVDDLIDARVEIIAPGITEEQKKEPLCGYTIREVIGFIGRGSDRYVEKFRKIERGNKHTFNWAAFFFSPFWFFYRKMHRFGIIFLTIDMAISVLSYRPSSALTSFIGSYDQTTLAAMTEADMTQFMQDYMQLMIPLLAIFALKFIFALVAGFIADRSYHKYCRDSLKSIESNAVTDTSFNLKTFISKSSTSFWITMISILISSFLPNLLISIFSSV
ncbi:MAG: DUF2628 domain-containing protein [Faecalibacterium sp.]|nr:DUF2628 domain-containing protein [Ruminococcus sp.]MCM1393002.1 DUF2628 domain-containing protein [Ruminococcus sp.]MCM1486512.1 DUF2628 domain-containing protein [Faecalibacterium sp.]